MNLVLVLKGRPSAGLEFGKMKRVAPNSQRAMRLNGVWSENQLSSPRTYYRHPYANYRHFEIHGLISPAQRVIKNQSKILLTTSLILASKLE